MPLSQLTRANREFWEKDIHDLKITRYPIGTPEFFEDLETYRYEKLNYLSKRVKFDDYRSKRLLEIGCGNGIDLKRFAQSGANVCGVDFSAVSVELARRYFGQENLPGDFSVMDGEDLGFADNSFDVIYAFGVLQYTVDPQKMMMEIYRVMKKGGEGIFMVYNRHSWMNLLSKIMHVELELQNAPFFRKFSLREYGSLLKPFSHMEIIPERFPVKTRLHRGFKASLYNRVFVGLFNSLPRWLIQSTGWHLLALVKK